MSLWSFFVLFILTFFSFQNCSSFEGVHSLSDFYPYTTRPDFFYDLKLIRSEVDENNRRRYVIDIVMSYSQDPEQGIDYELEFSTLEIANVCPTRRGSAVGDSKRVLVECLVPVPDEELFVQLVLRGPDSENLRKVYKFASLK